MCCVRHFTITIQRIRTIAKRKTLKTFLLRFCQSVVVAKSCCDETAHSQSMLFRWLLTNDGDFSCTNNIKSRKTKPQRAWIGRFPQRIMRPANMYNPILVSFRSNLNRPGWCERSTWTNKTMEIGAQWNYEWQQLNFISNAIHSARRSEFHFLPASSDTDSFINLKEQLKMPRRWKSESKST